MLNQDQVKLIFKDNYNFYLRWKDMSQPEQWVDLMDEMREIDNRYQCELSRQILMELVKVIENEYIARRDSSE